MSMSTDPYFSNKKADVKNQGAKIDPRRAALYEKLNSTRPASEIILDDDELQLMLNVSTRTTSTWREGLIDFSQNVPYGKVFYTLQYILDFIESGRKLAISSKRKF